MFFLFACLIIVNFILGFPTNKITIIEGGNPAALIHPDSFPCKPNYPALVAIQARLAGDSSSSDQLLSSSGMVIEVGKLASELLFRSVHVTPASRKLAIALSDDLRRVEYILAQLDMSLTGSMER